MTITKFNETSFYKGLKIRHYSGEYLIVCIDFEEALIGCVEEEKLQEWQKGFIKTQWYRCENCEIINYKEIVSK